MEFTIDDLVYMKIMSSLAQKYNEKLSWHFFGPYKVVECAGVIAYQLALPLMSQVHTIFHVL